MGCPESMAASQAGSGKYLSEVAIQCTPFETLQHIRCCADAYDEPCKQDECSSAEDANNVCVREGASYRCECAQGWEQGQGGQSCVPSPDPCLRGDKCKSALDASNECVQAPRRKEKYKCRCGVDYQLSLGGLTCIPCDSPCEGDNPCQSDIAGNTCTGGEAKGPKGCIKHTCTCEAPGYVLDHGGQACKECRDPCVGDPCLSSRDSDNVCSLQATERDDECPTFKCECKGLNFLTNADGTCAGNARKPDFLSCFCSLDNCGHRSAPKHTLSALSPLHSSMHARVRTNVLSISISHPFSPPPPAECPDPCAGDPCQTAQNPQNICRPSPAAEGKCPASFTCVCVGQGWLVTPNQQKCLYCDNPCTLYDPCNVEDGGFTGNMCEMALAFDDDENQCPTAWLCTCQAPYIAPPDMRSCLQCIDTCADDPCNVGSFPGSSCISAYLEGDDMGACPANHRCTCAGQGVKPTWDLQKCVQCEDLCAADADPCLTRYDPANRCSMVDPGPTSCPTEVVCSCHKPLYVPSPDRSECFACTDMCADDPCKVEGTQNTCHYVWFDGDRTRCPSDWQCTCEDRNYMLAEDSLSCIKCPSSCDANPCLQDESDSNVCVPAYGRRDDPTQCPTAHQCACNEYPYINTKNRRSCVKCRSPCESNPCSAGPDNSNQCQVVIDEDGDPFKCPQSFLCICGGFPYVPALDRQSCMKCDDPCEGDLCLTAGNPDNACYPEYDIIDDPRGCPSTYSCECKEPGYITGLEPLYCEKCVDACDLDPCNTAADSINKCSPVNLGPDVCPSHTCQCNYPYFTPSQDGFSCDECPNPCAADPCMTEENPDNRCSLARAPTDGPLDCPSAYICTCVGLGWVTPVDQQYCIYCHDPCKNDPCNSQGNSKNTCRATFHPDDTICPTAFECSCLGFGWVATPAQTACYPCPNPCDGDPCNRQGDIRNLCVPLVPPPGRTSVPITRASV